MPSEIYFASENLRVTVEEDPAQVAEAFATAHGLPFRLTDQGGRGEVYVNPASVLFWSAPESDREPELQHEAPPPAKREPVTDIWGNAVSRKRRR